MPPLKPVSRRELISKLTRLGFSEPRAGGKHQFMRRGSVRVILPNPHRGDITPPLLFRLLQQAGIDPETWNAL